MVWDVGRLNQSWRGRKLAKIRPKIRNLNEWVLNGIHIEQTILLIEV